MIDPGMRCMNRHEAEPRAPADRSGRHDASDSESAGVAVLAQATAGRLLDNPIWCEGEGSCIPTVTMLAWPIDLRPPVQTKARKTGRPVHGILQLDRHHHLRLGGLCQLHKAAPNL